MSFVVSTPWSETPAAVQRAQELAHWFSCPHVTRNARSLVRLCRDEGVDACLIADAAPKFYHVTAPEKALFFHPGIAMQRWRNLQNGEGDRLLRAAGVRPGDTVIDATLGLGSDSIILAAGVGAEGRVDAVEASEALAKLFSYAIYKWRDQALWLQPLLQRIHVQHSDNLAYLRRLPEDSADIVYFDPMFRSPSRFPSSADSLRSYADDRALSEEVVSEAGRVARRTVIVKERRSSGVFERFGMLPDKLQTRFSYGVLHIK